MPSESATVAATQEAPCALCGAALPEGPTARVNGHLVCASCMAQVEREVAAQKPTAATFVPAAGLGLVGALAGALVWSAIGIATNLAVGYVAVLVGYLSGMGVKIGARTARGQPLQILAAGLAVVGLVAAKYMQVAYYLVAEAAKNGVTVTYFDPRILSIFGGVFTKTLSPFDLLWLVLAVGAAYRVPKAKPVRLER
jgi:hypothetical protein